MAIFAGPIRMRLLAAVFFLFLASCANLQPAEAPVYRWTDVHLFGVTAIAFNPDGTLLASGGHRGEIAIWNVQTHARVADASGLGEPVRALQWFGDRLLSGDRNGLALWRARDLALLQKTPTSAVAGLAADANGFFSAHRDGSLRVRFSADGKALLGGGWFRLLTWDIDSARASSRAAEHNGLLTSVDSSNDNRWIATVGRHTDSAIRIWRRDDYQIVRRLAAHDLCGAMIRFSPDGRFLASASDDESIALLDLLAPPLSR